MKGGNNKQEQAVERRLEGGGRSRKGSESNKERQWKGSESNEERQ